MNRFTSPGAICLFFLATCISAADKCHAQGHQECTVPIAGPRIGINVAPFKSNALQGVRVTNDRTRRTLYRQNAAGVWRGHRFRVGFDVIVKLNGMQVLSAEDVLMSTQHGWNDLYILDTSTGETGIFKVRL